MLRVFGSVLTHAESFLSQGLLKVELERGDLVTAWTALEVG